MSQYEFHIATTAEHEEALGDELMELGVVAVTNQDAGNQAFYEPKPGEYLQWDKTLLIALLEDESPLEIIHGYLDKQLALQRISGYTLKKLDDINWVAHTQRQFKPQQFGNRLWICPTWETPPQADAVNVILDPGCAFGTGTHPTTALCLEWLDENVKGGETVIDYGCGSGILAIAAIKLGARHAIAIDHDPEAIEVTRENANKNGVSSQQMTACLPNQFNPQQASIVIANIITGPLIELAPLFATLVATGGRIVLSGILSTQIEEIIALYEKYFTQIRVKQKDEWMRLDAYKA